MPGLSPYVSLFSGGGVGDIGFRNAGLTPLVLNELESPRAQLAQLNFPNADVIVGDVREHLGEIEARTKLALTAHDAHELFLLSATPPCQGMSKNGIGSILKAMRDGKRPKVDARNYLFEPVLEALQRLSPKFLFFENVDRMANTYVLDGEDERSRLVDVLVNRLRKLGYLGEFRLVNMLELGVPQNRRRMVGIFGREDVVAQSTLRTSSLFPCPMSKEKVSDLTVRSIIGCLPPLDSKCKSTAASNYHPLHHVPVSRADLYHWIEHTQEGDTAFNNNMCVNCGHVSSRQSVACESCQEILPKPTVTKGGEVRLIKGFVSAYKRMKYDAPSPTITTRSAYACSDHNLHPDQNRVLSLLEVSMLQGLDPDEYACGPFVTKSRGKPVTLPIAHDTLLRDILGEPVPPVFSEAVGRRLLKLENGDIDVLDEGVTEQLELPYYMTAIVN
jgi:DNA (cytosine-5)-methyltransferase 1